MADIFLLPCTRCGLIVLMVNCRLLFVFNIIFLKCGRCIVIIFTSFEMNSLRKLLNNPNLLLVIERSRRSKNMFSKRRTNEMFTCKTLLQQQYSPSIRLSCTMYNRVNQSISRSINKSENVTAIHLSWNSRERRKKGTKKARESTRSGKLNLGLLKSRRIIASILCI